MFYALALVIIAASAIGSYAIPHRQGYAGQRSAYWTVGILLEYIAIIWIVVLVCAYLVGYPSGILIAVLVSAVLFAVYLHDVFGFFLPSVELVLADERKLSSPIRHPLLRIAHLSDLHICSQDTVEGGINYKIVRAKCAKVIDWACHNSDFVFFTGDITDAGLADEWKTFRELCKCLPRNRIMIVPGNHDLSLELQVVPSKASGLLMFEQRCYHFARNVLQDCPEDWYFISSNGPLRLKETLAAANDYIEAYSRNPPELIGDIGAEQLIRYHHNVTYLAEKHEKLNGSVWPTLRHRSFASLLRIIYPMVLYRSEEFLIVGLNSNIVGARSIFTSALGSLGRHQLNLLQGLLRENQSRRVLLLIHHHIGIPTSIRETLYKRYSKIELRALQLRDAARLKTILNEHDNCVVFHGHKHVAYQGMLGSNQIISAPSVLYGDVLTGSNDVFTFSVGRAGGVAAAEALTV